MSGHEALGGMLPRRHRYVQEAQRTKLIKNAWRERETGKDRPREMMASEGRGKAQQNSVQKRAMLKTRTHPAQTASTL